MRLPTLIHLLESARTLSGCQRVRVLGSSALLASFPTLGEAGGPLEFSYERQSNSAINLPSGP